MKKEKNISTLIYDLIGLINLAEVNYLACKKIYDDPLKNSTSQHPKGVLKNKNEDFLLLAANNSFFEAISILHTLIASKITVETRIEPVIKQLVAEKKISNDEIDNLKKNKRGV
jgi:hypothetical protein